MNAAWSAADDRELWGILGHLPRTGGGNLATNRNVNALVKGLAARFNRTDGAIKSRLKHLDDPSHAAHARLNGTAPPKRQTTSSYAPPPKRQDTAPYVPPSTVPPASVSACTMPPTTTTAVKLGDLNAGQRDAHTGVLAGDNVFITGAAGTGKSFLLRCMIDTLEARLGSSGVAVTAPTGIAASHINGQTLHSWAGIGLGKGNASKLLEKVMGNASACERWRRVRALVVDEISMLDGQLFTSLEYIARAVRGSSRPFGGVQLVLCGDFFQLPPVSLQYGGFCFQSGAWDACAIRMHQLREIVRQQGDRAFIRLLNEVRSGVCSAETTAQLEACHVHVKPRPSDGIVPTRLYCTNRNVDAENLNHLHALPAASTRFDARDAFKREPESREGVQKLLDAIEKKAPRALELKVGAQVMLTKNWADAGLVNGSRGVVVGFKTGKVDELDRMSYGVAPGDYTCPVVRFDSGATHVVKPATTFQALEGGAVVRTQIPIKLAWALTVHKSQGMTLSRCELQLEDAFAPGQVYVALSRVTSLAGLWLSGGAITQAVVMAHSAVINFYQACGAGA